MPAQDPTALLRKLKKLLGTFESQLKGKDLRAKVLALVPALHAFRALGVSLVPKPLAASARDRILLYFQKYPRKVIRGDELLVVSGIQEWPRRLRELRVEFGWRVLNGLTVRQMVAEGDMDLDLDGESLKDVKVDDYVMVATDQDRDAALRWNVANEIRKGKSSIRDKLLRYFQENAGKVVRGDELAYVAKSKPSWPRRTRELRTEFGWPVYTGKSGRPDLGMGEYILEQDRQTPPHDRKIADDIRLEVLERDRFRCTKCGWNRDKWHPDAPRSLELHHVRAHVKRGANTADNLVTLCTVCHDATHKAR